MVQSEGDSLHLPSALPSQGGSLPSQGKSPESLPSHLRGRLRLTTVMQTLLDMIMDMASERSQLSRPHDVPDAGTDISTLLAQLRLVAGLLLGCCVSQHSTLEPLYGSRIEVGEVKVATREALAAQGDSIDCHVLVRLHAWACGGHGAPRAQLLQL
jgi:hypothetical protein